MGIWLVYAFNSILALAVLYLGNFALLLLNWSKILISEFFLIKHKMVDFDKVYKWSHLVFSASNSFHCVGPACWH